jgi:ribosome-associated translation inhibitor RaiA
LVAATVASALRVAPQFRSDEFDGVASELAARLDRRLSRFDENQVELEISVKDRDSAQQQVTLEAWIAAKGRTRFVATSTEGEIKAAVRDVAEGIQRQIDKFVTKREASRRG